VLPDQPCVWVRIRGRAGTDNGVHIPVDKSLLGSSSLTNYLTGRDKDTRLLRPYRGHTRADSKLPSVFSRKFKRIEPIVTYEIASPREVSGLARVEEATMQLEPFVDGINTTTNAGGVPSLHSLETARIVVKSGVSPIVQFCGRDQDADTFRREVREALADGFANILALTGDWNPHQERERCPTHWFPMDSLQMVDILAGKSGFEKRPFIGVASTAYTTPMDVSVERLLAKLRAGADFTQTQIITETHIFGDWLQRIRSTPEGRNCRILASVPLIGKSKPYEIMRGLPGVYVDAEFSRQLGDPDEFPVNGLTAARDLIRQLLRLDIDGVHLMNFGVPIPAVIDFIQEIRSYPLDSVA
jgi:5,10-methylenetetrahydrofolate reductase